MKPTASPPRHWLDSWHVNASTNRNYDFMDGLRGVAILMVVACHYFYVNPASGPVVRFIGSLTGTMGSGVTLFFTISGFLIAGPFWKRKFSGAAKVVPPGYGWRRFWKIYPPLALSVILLTPCWILWRGDEPLYLQTAVQWLTGAAFVVPVTGKFNPVMWSLVVEVHFYLVLPLLFLAARKLAPKPCLWCITLFFLITPIVTRILTGRLPAFYPEIYDPFPAGLTPFCLGVLLAGVDNLGLWHKGWAKWGDAGCGLLPASLLGLAWLHLNPDHQNAVLQETFSAGFILGAGGLLCYAADPENPRARWLCTPWLRWCGIISYEWYLIHQPMTYWIREFFGPAAGNVFIYLLVIIVPLFFSLTVAALFYRNFSLPILKYGRGQKSALK